VKVVMLCGGLGRACAKNRVSAQAHGGNRRSSDPVAYHEVVRAQWFHRFCVLPWLPRQYDQGIFPELRAMNNDFSLCLGRNSKIEYKNVHREQDFQVTLVDTGPTTMTADG